MQRLDTLVLEGRICLKAIIFAQQNPTHKRIKAAQHLKLESK